MKVLVIGHSEAVLGFSLVGISGRVATTHEEAAQALEDALSTPDAGIILVTEDAARLLEARMDQLKLRGTVPLVVEIPGPSGVRANQSSLREIVRRAIGVRI